MEEREQYQPVFQESGIPVLRVFTNVSSRNGFPSDVEISVVNSIRLGDAIPSNRLNVIVPEGVLADQFQDNGVGIPESRGGTRPKMEVVKNRKPRALDLVREPGFGLGHQQPEANLKSQPSKWMFIVNAIALMLLASYLGLRRFRQIQSSSKK